jgi:hypothetical protein
MCLLLSVCPEREKSLSTTVLMKHVGNSKGKGSSTASRLTAVGVMYCKSLSVKVGEIACPHFVCAPGMHIIIP